MADYAFYSFMDETLTAYGVELLPVPVRSEVQEEVFGGEEVRVDLLLDELDRFLYIFPELADLYSGTMEALTWMAAMREGGSGNTEAAARYLETGLGAVPGSLLLRSNYAVVLQLQGRSEDALEQYEVLLSDPEGRKDPMVKLLAARLYAEEGKYLEAYRLLDEMAHGLPADDAFWDFLAEMKELAEAEGHEAAGEGSEAGYPAVICPACGHVLERGHRFCRACGKEVAGAVPQGSVCAGCGSPLKEGASFCSQCGRPVAVEAPDRAICDACGSTLLEGASFCRQCGRPVEEARPSPALCDACGSPLREGASFCRQCGKPVGAARTDRAFCPACGNAVEVGLMFCNRCGERL